MTDPVHDGYPSFDNDPRRFRPPASNRVAALTLIAAIVLVIIILAITT